MASESEDVDEDSEDSLTGDLGAGPDCTDECSELGHMVDNDDSDGNVEDDDDDTGEFRGLLPTTILKHPYDCIRNDSVRKRSGSKQSD